MSNVIGKIFKYVLWFAFFVILGGLFFGLMKFKFDYVSYISYLNSFDITRFVSGYINNKPLHIEDVVLIEETGLNNDFSGNDLVGDNLDVYDSNFEDTFMQNTGSASGFSNSGDEYGFKPTQNLSSGSAKTDTGVSKKQLLDLIKSEK